MSRFPPDGVCETSILWGNGFFSCANLLLQLKQITPSYPSHH
jgi:hypothetical protein